MPPLLFKSVTRTRNAWQTRVTEKIVQNQKLRHQEYTSKEQIIQINDEVEQDGEESETLQDDYIWFIKNTFIY